MDADIFIKQEEKRMKKLVCVFLAVMLLFSAASVFARGGRDSDQAIKIGFTIGDLTNPVWVSMYQEMEKKAKELGAQILVNAANYDVNSQINAIENFITAGCQVIIIHAFDYESAVPAAAKAQAQGIKILAYDVDLPNSDARCILDNYATGKVIGKMAGNWINQNLDGKGVVGVCGFPHITIIVERQKGIEDGLLEASPTSQIVARVRAGLPEEGVKEGENFIQAHPNMNVVCGINDAGILGVYEAFKGAGWDKRNVALFGCDAVTDAINAIDENGIYKGTVFLQTDWAGGRMIEEAVKMAKGQPYEETIIMPGEEVTYSNINNYK
jgi:ribose transport system substrate-binding protein